MSGPMRFGQHAGRAMGRSALIGVVAIVAIELATSGGAFGGDPTFHLRLERGMCLGSCPVYTVDIDAAGNVTFVGRKSVTEPSAPCQGERRWKIDAAAVTRLRDLVDRSGFFGFKDSYSARVTDLPPYTVTVTRKGRTKTVRDYVGQMAGMPPAMTQLENAIDNEGRTLACVVARRH
jgi:hypothetical protein